MLNLTRVILLIFFITNSLFSKSQNNDKINASNDSITNSSIISIGLLLGINDQYIDNWNIGVSFSAVAHKAGFYLDYKYGSNNTADSINPVKDIGNISNHIWHIGVMFSIREIFRPYASLGTKHYIYKYRIKGISGHSEERETTPNASIGFIIGSKKSVIGVQAGIEIDSPKAGIAISGVGGININF